MLDLLIVLAFVAYALSAGWRARRQASRSLEDYFLAGKTLRGWQAGTSMAATQFAADTPLLVTGLIATGGIFMLWRLWIYGLAFLLMAFIFATQWREARVLTDAELTEIRYSGRGVLPLRVLKALYYGTVINCVVLAIVLVAAVRIAEVFLPWHDWLPGAVFQPIRAIVTRIGIPIASNPNLLDPWTITTDNLISIAAILGFTALYSMTGGLRSVVTTDVGQFSIAMIGTTVYAWIVLREAGGLASISARLTDLYGVSQASRMLSFAPPASELLGPFLVVIGLQWLFQMNSDGTGYLAQRSMACRSDRDARLAGVLFAWLQIVLRSLIWLVIGIGLLVLYPFEPGVTGPGFAAEREMTFVRGIDELLPIGIRGLMLTGLLAALASTLDTHMNWGASYWSNDIYKRLICEHWLKREPSRREAVAVARLANLLILAMSILVMANLGSIQTAWFISLLFGAGMGGVLVLRWLWERINLWSEIAAIAASLACAPLLLLYITDEWLRLLLMALVSTSAAIAVIWVTPRTEDAVLVAFFRRVQPSGWWSHTAALAGADARAPRRALLSQLSTTAAAAASLFFVLYGAGRLLIPVPNGSPVPPLAALVIGVVLAPIWWPSIMRERPGTKEPRVAS
ncbi:MAG: sodium:solute symporter family protein [Gemmatimonadota bacterium]